MRRQDPKSYFPGSGGWPSEYSEDLEENVRSSFVLRISVSFDCFGRELLCDLGLGCDGNSSGQCHLHNLTDRCALLDGTAIDIHEAYLLNSRAVCPDQRRVAHHDGQCFGSGDRYVEPVAVEQELHAPGR